MAGSVLTGQLSPRNIRPDAPIAKRTLLIYCDERLFLSFVLSLYIQIISEPSSAVWLAVM